MKTSQNTTKGTNQSSEHTKGEWGAHIAGNSYRTTKEGDIEVRAQISSENLWEQVAIVPKKMMSGLLGGTPEANAKLIAAAPSMLEALNQALFAIPTTHGCYETVAQAIKKAIG